MKLLSGLYIITDEMLMPENSFSYCVEEALLGGAKIIQYRDKSKNHQKRLRQAQQIKTLCQQYEATFLINDDVELAEQVSADGVHIGLDDISISAARKILGVNKIIGVSCYNKIELAQEAQQAGADYLAFGRLFSSSTKPDAAQASLDLFAQAKVLQLPLCGIGGIHKDNAAAVLEAGADMLAVIGGVFADKNVRQNCAELSCLF